MRSDNMFLKAWEEKTTPLIRTIEENTTAYTKAATQTERDRINTTIKQADSNLSDLYSQLEEAYSSIFPSRIIQDPKAIQETEPAAPLEGFSPFEPAPSANQPIIFRADNYTADSVAEITAPVVDSPEQHALDTARRDQLINQLSDIPLRYSRANRDDPDYDNIGTDRLKWTTELNEIEDRMKTYKSPEPISSGVSAQDPEEVPPASEVETNAEEEPSGGNRRRRGVYLFLVVFLIALTAGSVYLLNKGGFFSARENADTPIAGSSPDAAYFFETLRVTQPSSYTNGSLKTTYTEYNPWAQDAGIMGQFTQTQHETIRDYFFAAYIQGQSAEVIAEHTVKFFWAADLYNAITTTPDAYAFLQQSNSSVVQAVYADISQNENYGLAISTIVQQYDALRPVIDQAQV